MNRLQLALNVPDLEEAVDFYSRLFATEPHKRRAGYANFEVVDPPLKLVLFENPDAHERLNHLGVEAPDQDALTPVAERWRAAGLVDLEEEATECCHAVQDKVWATAPDGGRWEAYTIVDDAPAPSPVACSACG